MNRDDQDDDLPVTAMANDDKLDDIEKLDDLDDTAEDRDEDQEVNEIRGNIEQTRAEMSSTIDEIQERLSPSYLKEQVKEQVKEQFEDAKEMVREATIGKVQNMVERASDAVTNTSSTIWARIKANPIPAALIGVGLVWMWRNGSGKSTYRTSDFNRSYDFRSEHENARSIYAGRDKESQPPYNEGLLNKVSNTTSNLANRATDSLSNAVGQIQETAGNLTHSARETASSFAGSAKDAVGTVVDQAQVQAQRAQDTLQTVLRENPLAVGAVALALGAAAGLSIPQTQKENQWMGEARDSVMDKAQSVAQDTIQQAQRVAEKVTDEMGGAK